MLNKLEHKLKGYYIWIIHFFMESLIISMHIVNLYGSAMYKD